MSRGVSASEQSCSLPVNSRSEKTSNLILRLRKLLEDRKEQVAKSAASNTISNPDNESKPGDADKFQPNHAGNASNGNTQDNLNAPDSSASTSGQLQTNGTFQEMWSTSIPDNLQLDQLDLFKDLTSTTKPTDVTISSIPDEVQLPQSEFSHDHPMSSNTYADNDALIENTLDMYLRSSEVRSILDGSSNINFEEFFANIEVRPDCVGTDDSSDNSVEVVDDSPKVANNYGFSAMLKRNCTKNTNVVVNAQTSEKKPKHRIAKRRATKRINSSMTLNEQLELYSKCCGAPTKQMIPCSKTKTCNYHDDYDRLYARLPIMKAMGCFDKIWKDYEECTPRSGKREPKFQLSSQ